MSSAGRGYGEGFFYSPEDQAAQEGIRRRQAYAQALMQGRQHQGQYGGLADAGNSIAGALLAKRADKDATKLAGDSQSRYASSLADLLRGGSGQSPQVSNAPQELDPEGNPMASTGAPQQPRLDPEGNPMSSQAPSQGQPQSIAERIAASGNPALMFQFGPQALQAQMQNENVRGNKIWENDLPESRAAREGRAGALQSQEKLAEHNNLLPMNAAQTAADQRAKDQNTLGYAQLNKPVQLSYGSTLVNPKTGQPMGGGLPGAAPGGSSPFGTGDAASTSINGQLGLSSMGYNYITGNTSQMGMRDKAMAAKEVDGLIARTGLDASTVKPQVQAFQGAVNMNTLKANTMDTLAKEITGTVQNYGPVIDQLTGNRNLRLTNKGFELFGSATNDPTAQKAIFYLNQMRADMAGFNAASGGKIGVHGQTQTDNADFAKADDVIKAGLSSGGARALGEAVEATRQKNVAVAKQQVIEAQRGIWNALGIGQNFDKTHPQAAPAPAPNPGDGPKTFHYNAQGKRVPG